MPISNSLTVGNAVPFQRTVDSHQLGLYLNLGQAEMARIQRYAEYWRFYLGEHWTFQREDGEPLVTVNYVRKFIDKGVEFLFNKGFATFVPESLEYITLPFLKEAWAVNKSDLLALEMGLMGGVTGDVFVLVTYEEPTPQAKRAFPNTRGSIRINLLKPEQVFPKWNPLNKNVLESVRIETLYYDEGIGPNGVRQIVIKRFTQIISDTEITEQVEGAAPRTVMNPLGEIPLVHIPNLPVPGEYYGISDAKDLIDLQREFNEKCTDISDIIAYQAAPVTVLFGASASALPKGPNQMWAGLPVDAKIEVIGLNSDLGAANNYVDRIKLAMHEIGDVPEGSLGKTIPISNTSGVALSMSNLPSESRAQKKRITYGIGITLINYFILRIGVIQNLIKLPYDLCKHCGGRILEVDDQKEEYQWNGTAYELRRVMTKKCYMVHPQTLELLSVSEAQKLSEDESDDELDLDEFKSRVERVSKARMTLYHPQTGEFVQFVELTNAELVRTECSRKIPEYQNPYENMTVFPSTLPTDESAEATLYQTYQENGWVDVRWVRQNIPRISKDSDALEKRAKRRNEATNANMEKRNTEGTTSNTPSGSSAGNEEPRSQTSNTSSE